MGIGGGGGETLLLCEMACGFQNSEDYQRQESPSPMMLADCHSINNHRLGQHLWTAISGSPSRDWVQFSTSILTHATKYPALDNHQGGHRIIPPT